MKRLLTALLLLTLGAGPAMAETFADEIPDEYLRGPKEAGVIQRIAYPSQDYLTGTGETTKHAVVYLPYGYTEEKQYKVLILCHGVGGTEDEWGFAKPYSIQKAIIDNLIARGEIEPLIIVMPNGRSSTEPYKTSMEHAQDFYCFGKELRNDLLPWIDEHFATYTGDRMQRAMAGLSMGGMQTINIGLCECLDCFAWFGAFSAAPTTYEAAQIAEELKKFPEEEIAYFYSLCGTEDNLYFAGAGAAKELPNFTDRVTEKNWHWQERSGGHDFGIWNLGLYNFVQIFAGTQAK
ncbi:MAG: esterase family protein [Clostridia bacterium]|nr:esterase family protein [Clostridia bacterium]